MNESEKIKMEKEQRNEYKNKTESIKSSNDRVYP